MAVPMTKDYASLSRKWRGVQCKRNRSAAGWWGKPWKAQHRPYMSSGRECYSTVQVEGGWGIEYAADQGVSWHTTTLGLQNPPELKHCTKGSHSSPSQQCWGTNELLGMLQLWHFKKPLRHSTAPNSALAWFSGCSGKGHLCAPCLWDFKKPLSFSEAWNPVQHETWASSMAQRDFLACCGSRIARRGSSKAQSQLTE